jgi:hypothetical protein
MPPPDRTLNDLSLADLTDLSGTLVTLEAVGRDLDDQGLAPRFDLTPGEAVTITTNFRMPFAPNQATLQDVARIELKLDRRLADLDFSQPMTRPAQTADLVRQIMEDTPSTEAAPTEAALEPVEPPAAVQSAGGTLSAAPSRSGDEAAPLDQEPDLRPGAAVAEATPPPLAEAASSEGVAESGGGQQVMAAATPPAAPPAAPPGAPPAGSASAMAASALARAPGWTTGEDDRLIALVVSGVTRLGLTKRAAVRAAAQELGRPEDGTVFRCYNKLRDRLDAALAQGVATLAQPEPDPIPEGPAQADATDGQTASDGDAAGEAPTSPAVQPSDLDARSRETAIAHGTHTDQPAPAKAWNQPDEPAPAKAGADPVTAHLMTLPDKGGWTLDRDLELMELSIAGWQPQEIALQLTMPANLIKPRFDLLTGLYEDATGKKVRRFTREAVFFALQALKSRSAA